MKQVKQVHKMQSKILPKFNNQQLLIKNICLSTHLQHQIIIQQESQFYLHKSHQIMNVHQFIAICAKQYQRNLINEIEIDTFFRQLSARIECAIETSHKNMIKLIYCNESLKIGCPDLKMQMKQFSSLAHDYISQLFTPNSGYDQRTHHLLKQADKLKINFQDQLISINKFEASMKSLNSYDNQQKMGICFQFSGQHKNNVLQVSDNGHRIRRMDSDKQGKSVYGLVNRPLDLKQHSQITFKIIKQPRRFIYFGVCDRQTFQRYGYQGSTFKRNGRMYAIRQSHRWGSPGICLHNSIKQYSDQPKVGWDFKQGDQITISIQQTHNNLSLTFLWNDTLYFQMPLDQQTDLFYPFVGLKYYGDQVAIVQKSMAYQSDSFAQFKQNQMQEQHQLHGQNPKNQSLVNKFKRIFNS